MQIGVIGIGTMGILTVELLVKSGESVVVSDVIPESLQRAKEIGCNSVGFSPSRCKSGRPDTPIVTGAAADRSRRERRARRFAGRQSGPDHH